MSNHTNELKFSEVDKPNTNAIYIIIVCCLVGLALTFWGLAEYKGYIKQKRLNKIQTMQFEAKEALKIQNQPAVEVIENALEAK